MTLWYQFLGEPVHVTVHGFFPLVHLCVGWGSLSSFLADFAGLLTTLSIIEHAIIYLVIIAIILLYYYINFIIIFIIYFMSLYMSKRRHTFSLF